MYNPRTGVRLTGGSSNFLCLLKRVTAVSIAILSMVSYGAVQAQAQAVDEIAAKLQAQQGQGLLQRLATGQTSATRAYPFQLKHGVDKVGRLTPLTAPAGAHLSYFGGPVIGTVQVVIVLYGTGSYISQLTSTTTPNIAGFYSTITNDGMMDLLSQYNTTGVNFNGTTTNQVIAHGGANSVLGTYTISPSAANNGSTITDAQIQTELKAQIAAGHLPASTFDANGNTNTIYMTYFPPGKSISQGGSSSCVSGGFCAYHGTAVSGTHNLLYGVLPDMQAGSGCATGCGSSTTFGNYTSVSSHELVEAITDAAVGLATVNGPPLAWYDTTNGEIGDICNAQQGTLDGYTVQLEFSNSANNCVLPASGSTGTNDFSITGSAVSIAQGASGTSAVTTAVIAGSAATVSLTVSGAPTGVTATLSPTSVTAGAGSTLSITVASTAVAGSYTLTVTGTEATKVHSASVALTITTAGGGGTSLTNGGFETGNLSGWTAAGAIEAVSTTSHTGTYSSEMGSTSPTNGDSTISQTFTAPAGATGLSFYYKMTCPDTVTYDWSTATLKDNTAGTTATLLPKTCVTSAAWTQVAGTLIAAHSYTLSLTSHDDNYAGDPSYTLYDDATITTSGGGGGGTGVTNGGFETGSTGWTLAGALESVATTGCHTGVGCAQDGSTSATNGDSSYSQTFTVPTGKTSLSLWYKMTCPDTVTYDWATVTLKNNTTNAITTILPKTCATAAWINKTAAVTAGTSYTLTLTSHDDNYAADPSYTLYDDITLN